MKDETRGIIIDELVELKFVKMYSLTMVDDEKD